MKSHSFVRSFAVLGAGLVLTLLSACTTATVPKIASHPDTTVRYGDYKTFMMLHPAGLAPTRDAAITPTLVRQMREEAGKAFTEKGMTKTSDGFADMLVLVHGGLQQKLDVNEWGLRAGRFGHPLMSGQELDSYKEGTLFVDVFDGKTRELVWRGTAMAQVDTVPDVAQLRSTIDTIIARYPN